MSIARCRVKVCGIRSVEDALMVVEFGADALGLVFYPKSSRYIDVSQAAEICRTLPPFVTTVGLFLDASAEEVSAVLERVPLDLLQFHGSESPDFCRQFARPYIKAIGMKGLDSAADFAAYADAYDEALGLLVDSHEPGAAGGTGQTFDWENLPDYPKPLILAGGLNQDNVDRAIRQTGVYAVDISSGVESSPGCKDRAKMAAFMAKVRAVCD